MNNLDWIFNALPTHLSVAWLDKEEFTCIYRVQCFYTNNPTEKVVMWGKPGYELTTNRDDLLWK